MPACSTGTWHGSPSSATQRRARSWSGRWGREVQPIFVVRGKLLSKSLLFDMALAKACTAARLVDSAGKATITAHRFRHTIGTQLAEGGLATAPRTPACRTRRSNSSTKTPWTATRTRRHARWPGRGRLREHRLDPEAVSWLQTNFLKTELELGHCLRTPAEGPCECDLVLTCSKFLTTSDYAAAFALASRSSSSSSRTPPPAAGHARSNGTKQPNDAWSGSSTTWPEANLALDSGRSWSTVLGQSSADHRSGGTRDRSTCVPGGLLVRWSSDRTCRGHVTAPGPARPGASGGSVDWLRQMPGCGSTRIRRSAGVGAPLLVVVASHEPPVAQQQRHQDRGCTGRRCGAVSPGGDQCGDAGQRGRRVDRHRGVAGPLGDPEFFAEHRPGGPGVLVRRSREDHGVGGHPGTNDRGVAPSPCPRRNQQKRGAQPASPGTPRVGVACEDLVFEVGETAGHVRILPSGAVKAAVPGSFRKTIAPMRTMIPTYGRRPMTPRMTAALPCRWEGGQCAAGRRLRRLLH